MRPGTGLRNAAGNAGGVRKLTHFFQIDISVLINCVFFILILAFQVADRPMTQQGLGGMRTGATGYGRQVQDKTYFQSELRQRIGMINSEINNLTNEADTLEKDTANLGVYEKRFMREYVM